jgi:hypothetical protein
MKRLSQSRPAKYIILSHFSLSPFTPFSLMTAAFMPARRAAFKIVAEVGSPA